MALETPYSQYPIKIASASGTGTITFKKMQEPRILPNPDRLSIRKSTRTRPSAEKPAGCRVFSTFGSGEELFDISFELPYVLPEDFNTLLGWYMSNPGVVLVSWDGGTTRYLAMWKERGLKEFCYILNQREFYRVNIELEIIAKTVSTVFDNMDPVDEV